MPAAVDFRPLPFVEAIAAFARRAASPRATDRWTDMMHDQHSAELTVARSLGYDILGDIHQALKQALSEGRTFQQFAQELTPVLQAKGWWGDVVDTDGSVVRLGSRRRLATIFHTNLRTSYAAGRWEQIQRTRKVLPYIMYTAVRDSRTRPEHLAWHGTILPVDHPWWDEHYPPCGWGCRCSVRQLTEGMARRLGGVTPVPPTGLPRQWLHPGTGQRIQVPHGIDPGWGYNVGKAAQRLREAEQAARRMAEAAIAAPPAAAAIPQPPAVAQALAREFAIWFDGVDLDRPRGEARVVGFIEQKALDWMAKREMPQPQSGAVVVTDHVLAHVFRAAKGARRPPLAVIRMLPERFAAPDAILWDNVENNIVYVFTLPDQKATRLVVRIDRQVKMRDDEGQRVRIRANPVVHAQLVDSPMLQDRTRYSMIAGQI